MNENMALSWKFVGREDNNNVQYVFVEELNKQNWYRAKMAYYLLKTCKKSKNSCSFFKKQLMSKKYHAEVIYREIYKKMVKTHAEC